MTEKNTQLEAGLASDLNRELEAYLFNDRVQEGNMEKHGFEHLFDETDNDFKKQPLHKRFSKWLQLAPMRLYYKVRPQCLKKHSPYAHLSDEFVEKNAFWLAGSRSKSQTYLCIKRKYHFGKCEDCSGRQWNEKEPYKIFVPTSKL